MSFIHGYLLAGLVLVGLPILLHLIMQQKPKILQFPAFRFLKQKQQSNRRKIQLQHWLLMLLRMLLIAALLFGLARPRLAGNLVPQSWRSALVSKIDRPVVALFLLDTSWSMDYHIDKQTRLDQACSLALRVFQQFPESTRVAVFETGEESSDLDWITSTAFLRARLSQLHLRPVAIPLPRLIDQANKILLQESKAEENPLPLLYVFSDRTESSWTNAEGLDLHTHQETTNPIHINYFDFGVDNPADVSIDKITVEPQTANPGQTIRVSVEVRATGVEFHDQVMCLLEKNVDLPLQQKLDLQAGQSKIVSFDFKAPPSSQINSRHGFLQLGVSLRQGENRLFEDALPFNNQAYATVAIRNERDGSNRKLLILADDPSDCVIWVTALETRARVAPSESFVVEVKSLQDAERLKQEDLQSFKVISLFQAVAPSPHLWEILEQYVVKGGSLCIVPAGKEIDRPEARRIFNDQGKKLLPGQLEGLRTVPSTRELGVSWTGYNSSHPLLVPFQEWSHNADLDFTQSNLKPFANRYWSIKPNTDSQVIISYDDREGSPALIEKNVGQGKVLLFSVVQDNRRFDAQGNDIRRQADQPRQALPGDRDWTNYWKDSSFGYLLTLKSLGYLSGDGPSQSSNYLAGQNITILLPQDTALGASFHLEGGSDLDLSASERSFQASREGNEMAPLVLPALNSPGNYRILDHQDKLISAFSLSIRPEESQLNRLPAATIETVLGEGALVKPTADFRPTDSLIGNKPPPIELLPLFMILMLLVLTFEGFLANWFSRGRSGVGTIPTRGNGV